MDYLIGFISCRLYFSCSALNVILLVRVKRIENQNCTASLIPYSKKRPSAIWSLEAEKPGLLFLVYVHI